MILNTEQITQLKQTFALLPQAAFSMLDSAPEGSQQQDELVKLLAKTYVGFYREAGAIEPPVNVLMHCGSGIHCTNGACAPSAELCDLLDFLLALLGYDTGASSTVATAAETE